MLRFILNSLMAVGAAMYTTLGLYACRAAPGASVDLPAANIPLEPKPAIVSILQSRPQDSLPLQQAIDLYLAANPGARINVQTVAGENDYRAALRVRLLSGERCDIFQVFSGQEARELSANLANLSDLSWISDAIANTAEPLGFNGGIYGLPHSVEAQGLLLNRDAFEAAGVIPGAINSLASLESAMEQLRAAVRESTQTDAFPQLGNITDFPIQDKSYLARTAGNILLTGEFENTADILAAREIKLANPTEDFFRLMMRYSPRDDWASRDGLSYSYQLERFANQEIALLLCSTADAAKILELNPALEGRLTLLPIMLPGDEHGRIYTSVPVWWAVGAHSEAPVQENAKRFLTWLYRSETGSVLTAARMGIASPWADTAKETANPVNSRMLALIEKGRSEPQLWREQPYDWGTGVLVPTFRSCFAGEIKWEDMLTALREEWALKMYGR